MKSISRNLSKFMASITIRNLDDLVKARLRMAAARHGCSMEEEVRQILRQTLLSESDQGQLGTRIHQQFAVLGGVDLKPTERSTPRPAPGFVNSDE